MNRKTVNQYILSGRISAAIQLMEQSIADNVLYRNGEQLQELMGIHRTLLNYMQQDVSAGEVQKMTTFLKKNLLMLSDEIHRAESKGASGSLYYRRLSEVEARQSLPLDLLLEDLASTNLKQENRENYDRLVGLFFDTLWVSDRLSDREQYLLASQDEYVRLMGISAITLGLMMHWDLSKVRFLLLEMARPNISVIYRVRLATGIFIAFQLYRYRLPLFEEELEPLVQRVFENKSYVSLFSELWYSYPKATETERVAEEIDKKIPQIVQNLRGRETGEFHENFILGEEAWQRLQEEAEEGNLSLEEISSLEGFEADAMFSMLKEVKKYPFFEDISAWFLPFDAEHSQIKSLLDGNAPLNNVLPFFAAKACNTDLYSFVLLLGRMPAKNIQIAGIDLDGNLQEINPEEHPMNLMEALDLNNPDRQCDVYMGDLLRFSKLFSFHEQFVDIFRRELSLKDLPLIAPYLPVEKLLYAGASFYYKQNSLTKAIPLYESCLEQYATDPEFLIKLGDCHYATLQYAKAVEFYQRADLVKDLSYEVLLRLAYCFKMMGRFDDCIKYYERTFKEYPLNLTLLIHMAQVYIEQGLYEEALPYLYKYEFTAPDGEQKVARLIAWSLFAKGDFERSQKYYQHLFDTMEVKPLDALNRAYVFLAQGDKAKAFQSLKQAYAIDPTATTSLVEALEGDKKLLDAHGVDTDALLLMIDGAETLQKRE